LLLVISMSVMGGHEMEIETLQERALELEKKGEGFMAAWQKVMADFYEQNGGRPPDWMVLAVITQMGAILLWVATTVAGVIALQRPMKRNVAAASLVIAGVVPVLYCCGGLAGL
ncbi:MAG: hypothetical protein D6788_03555, partial [Planctomycetota bacterium]